MFKLRKNLTILDKWFTVSTLILFYSVLSGEKCYSIFVDEKSEKEKVCDFLFSQLLEKSLVFHDIVFRN